MGQHGIDCLRLVAIVIDQPEGGGNFMEKNLVPDVTTVASGMDEFKSIVPECSEEEVAIRRETFGFVADFGKAKHVDGVEKVKPDGVCGYFAWSI